MNSQIEKYDLAKSEFMDILNIYRDKLKDQRIDGYYTPRNHVPFSYHILTQPAKKYMRVHKPILSMFMDIYDYVNVLETVTNFEDTVTKNVTLDEFSFEFLTYDKDKRMVKERFCLSIKDILTDRGLQYFKMSVYESIKKLDELYGE